MTTQATIGNSLLKSLITLREQKGQLNIEDVGAMLEHVAGALNPNAGMADKFLRSEIEKLASFIEQARGEVSSMTNAEFNNASGDATLELDAVIKATEEASNHIMDAADAIQNAAAGIGGEKEKTIMDAAAKIYENCNFQDLTGQRLTKVIKVLNEIDSRITTILGLFGSKPQGSEGGNVIEGNFDEKALLNGPQRNAPTQAEIDALFASFKP